MAGARGSYPRVPSAYAVRRGGPATFNTDLTPTCSCHLCRKAAVMATALACRPERIPSRGARTNASAQSLARSVQAPGSCFWRISGLCRSRPRDLSACESGGHARRRRKWSRVPAAERKRVFRTEGHGGVGADGMERLAGGEERGRAGFRQETPRRIEAGPRAGASASGRGYASLSESRCLGATAASIDASTAPRASQMASWGTPPPAGVSPAFVRPRVRHSRLTPPGLACLLRTVEAAASEVSRLCSFPGRSGRRYGEWSARAFATGRRRHFPFCERRDALGLRVGAPWFAVGRCAFVQAQTSGSRAARDVKVLR